MPVSYTNRKGLTYTLYRGQTKTGKPRYYFGRAGQGQGEPVAELPADFTISEGVNGVVSLVKDHPSLIQPEEVAAVEAEVQQHPEAGRYRVAVKHDRIEIYESVGPDYEALLGETHLVDLSSPGLAERLQAMTDRYARYTPVLRFILLDPARSNKRISRRPKLPACSIRLEAICMSVHAIPKRGHSISNHSLFVRNC